jgi:hypothetical protein
MDAVLVGVTAPAKRHKAIPIHDPEHACLVRILFEA